MGLIDDNTIGGKCSCCQECCSDILPLTVEEALAIVDYMLKNNIKPKARVRIFPRLEIDMRCCFVDDDTHTCMIYSVRPEICHKFLCNQDMKTINLNKIRASNRKGSNNVSMHVTFLREPHFIAYIQSEPELARELVDLRIEY